MGKTLTTIAAAVLALTMGAPHSGCTNEKPIRPTGSHAEYPVPFLRKLRKKICPAASWAQIQVIDEVMSGASKRGAGTSYLRGREAHSTFVLQAKRLRRFASIARKTSSRPVPYAR